MVVSAHFGNSTQMRYMEHDSPSEEDKSGCVLANLLSQSLAVYVELENTHWHLRLNQAGRGVNFESEGPTEIAREVCTISLRLIASISRLQRVLDPNVSAECAALCAVVEKKIAENRELASGGQFDPRGDIATLVSHGNVIHESHAGVQPHVATALCSSNWTERAAVRACGIPGGNRKLSSEGSGVSGK